MKTFCKNLIYKKWLKPSFFYSKGEKELLMEEKIKKNLNTSFVDIRDTSGGCKYLHSLM